MKEYNRYLLDSNIDIEQYDYFKYIHSKFYNHINIEFMGYFLNLSQRKSEFCVEHIKLQEYKVINNIKTSKDIRVCLNQYDLKEDIDYLVGNVPLQLSSGTKYSKQYMLTPYAFKLCLMRAKNSTEYANYYLMLEDMISYFIDYRLEYNKNLIKNISKENKKLHDNIEELLKYGKRTTEKLDETNEKLDDIKDELNDVKEELDETAEKLDDLHDKFDDMKDAFEETVGRSVPNPE